LFITVLLGIGDKLIIFGRHTAAKRYLLLWYIHGIPSIEPSNGKESSAVDLWTSLGTFSLITF